MLSETIPEACFLVDFRFHQVGDKVPPIGPRKHELDKVDNKEHTKLDGDKLIRLQRNCRQLRKAGSQKEGPSQGRAHFGCLVLVLALKTYIQTL